MSQGRIVIITGSPGTGKTTISDIVARESDLSKSVHIRTDDFYHYLSKGAIAPYLPESDEQNLIVVKAFLNTAKQFAHNGYDVIIDGIVGVWFLEPFIQTANDGYEIHYIILRASKSETIKRATERAKLSREENIELVDAMWNQFCDLGIYEKNVIDTTYQSIDETVSAVKNKIKQQNSIIIGGNI